MSAKKGHIVSEETRRKLSIANSGKKLSLEHRLIAIRNLKIRKVGEYKPTKETCEKISKSKQGQNMGEKHFAWKGDNAGYDAIHTWIHRHKLNFGYCEICGSFRKKLHASNNSGKYLRDVNDFEWSCFQCHRRKDNWNEKMWNTRKINEGLLQ